MRRTRWLIPVPLAGRTTAYSTYSTTWIAWVAIWRSPICSTARKIIGATGHCCRSPNIMSGCIGRSDGPRSSNRRRWLANWVCVACASRMTGATHRARSRIGPRASAWCARRNSVRGRSLARPPATQPSAWPRVPRWRACRRTSSSPAVFPRANWHNCSFTARPCFGWTAPTMKPTGFVLPPAIASVGTTAIVRITPTWSRARRPVDWKLPNSA
jgi:hypothetical protein